MEQFSINGKWWIPGNEPEIVAGSLEFNPGKTIFLNLNGSFKSLEQLFGDGSNNNFDIILGITTNGKRITLYKCYESNSNFSMSGYITTSYLVQYIFEGEHFETPERLSFERYLISFSNLENWTRISGFVQSFESNSDNSLSKVILTFKHPEEREITEIDDVKIGFDYTLNQKANIITSFQFTQTTYIRIEKNEGEISFEEFMSIYLYNLQNFLSFATGVTIYPLAIECGKQTYDVTFDNGKTKKNNFRILFSTPNYPEKFNDVPTEHMPLPYNFIKSDLGIILKNWFSKSDILQPIYDLYFGTLYNSTMYLQHRFLSIVQAIESYHRRIYGGSYLEGEKYVALKKRLDEIIKEELKGDLKNIFVQKLSYINEVSLRSRLKQLVAINSEFLDPIFKANKDFIDGVLNTRNYLTHYDENISEKAKKGEELFGIVEKLKFILEVCLMVEIGIPKEKILQNITHSLKYNYLKNF